MVGAETQPGMNGLFIQTEGLPHPIRQIIIIHTQGITSVLSIRPQALEEATKPHKEIIMQTRAEQAIQHSLIPPEVIPVAIMKVKQGIIRFHKVEITAPFERSKTTKNTTTIPVN